MSIEYKEIPQDMAVEQLAPTIKSDFKTKKYEEIISNMTYSDYLSAVYGYEEKARKKAYLDRKLSEIKRNCDEKRAFFQKLEKTAAEIREQRDLLHDEALNEQREKWQKTQDRMDIKISQEIGRAKQQAEAEISKRKNEYNHEVRAFNEKINYLKNEMLRLDNELKEINIMRDRLDNCTMDSSYRVADTDTLTLLEKARDKRWLTSYHRELLKTNVNTICDNRINSFEELKERELDFAHSDMIEQVRKGEVTAHVIAEFAVRTGFACAAAAAALALTAVFKPAVRFFSFFQAVLSCLFVGGFFLIISKIIGKRYGIKKKLEAMLLLGAFIAGGILGFFAWKELIFEKKIMIEIVYTLLSAAGTGFLLRHLLISRPLEKYLKKLPFLKNRARYYVFKNAVNAENGKYNLQIFCYLNHNEVLQYLTIKYKDSLTADFKNEAELNRNIYKKDREELSKMAVGKREIEIRRQKLKSFIKHRKAQLQEKIREIESHRGDTVQIAFEENIPRDVSDRIQKLDLELEALQLQLEKAEHGLRTAEEKFSLVNKKYTEILSQYDLIQAALRYWYKTPAPQATRYKLLDTMCFESNDQLSIIHHNLQPFAFRYTVSRRDSSPGKSLKSIIFRYIRGLIKINPCRMVQINIIDPVSEPTVFLEETMFRRLSPMGVISGVCSPNDFEIRLFSNERNYNTFRSVFKAQCGEIQRLLMKNSDRIESGEPYSVELANRIKNDENEPFMYQIMMFVVPREFDKTSFAPPAEIVKTMENGTYLNMGLLPVFFVDNDSIHEKWKYIVEMCPEGCTVNQGKGKHNIRE